jgi:hypothetical protein
MRGNLQINITEKVWGEEGMNDLPSC